MNATIYNWPEITYSNAQNIGFKIFHIGEIFIRFDSQAEDEKKNPLTDNEVINLYKKYSDHILDHIKGTFILVIIDEYQKVAYAFPSKSGLYKLFYYIKDDIIILSTCLDSIVSDSDYTGDINIVAAYEQEIFGYPLGNYTLFSNVFVLENSQYLKIGLVDFRTQKKQFYLVSDYLSENPSLSWDETYAKTPLLFNQIIEQFLMIDDKINAGLTSGFDSRTVLSRVINSKNYIQYYSYGTSQDSVDIWIPQKIADNFNLNYHWIKFDDNFFSKYDYYANQLLFLSDGFGNIKRCNQMYAHSILSEFSRVNLTGYIGSELLRPNNMMDTNIFPPMAKLVYSSMITPDIIRTVINKKSYIIQDKILDKYWEDIIEHIYADISKYVIYNKSYLNLYNYTVQCSLWKFFGQEFHSSRIYDKILSPYIDDEFVEFILKSPVPSINDHAFQRNINDLRLGQKFYLPIIKQNKPELGNIITGRGYRPNSLESKIYPFNLLFKYIIFRGSNKYLHRYAAFNAGLWNNITYNHNKEVFSYTNDYLKEIGYEHFNPLTYSIKRIILNFYER